MIEASGLGAVGGVRHGFFTRRGGVSDGVYASLNCGAGSGDDRNHVAQNRARVAARLGVAPQSLLTVRQVHGVRTVTVSGPWAMDGDGRPEADALVTATPGVAVGALTADCAPVLFADGHAGVVGAAHAGWKGALAGILESTIVAMETLGARRDRISAAIGPAIGPRAYEVGDEFERQFLAADSGSTRFFDRPSAGARPHFDLPAYVAFRLAAASLGHVEVIGRCTYAGESEFYSFRRATHRGETDYGRQISAIVLA